MQNTEEMFGRRLAGVCVWGGVRAPYQTHRERRANERDEKRRKIFKDSSGLRRKEREKNVPITHFSVF